jgi:hypothetical protein
VGAYGARNDSYFKNAGWESGTDGRLFVYGDAEGQIVLATCSPGSCWMVCALDAEGMPLDPSKPVAVTVEEPAP